MTRTLNSTISQQRHAYAYLYELEFSTGTIYMTNASRDITYNSNVYVAVGGFLVHDSIRETSDRRGQGVSLTLSGVDQSIISSVMGADFKGRPAKIYLVHFDPDTEVMETPDLVFIGRQNSDYEIEHTQSDEGFGGTVSVTTRLTSEVAEMDRPRPIRCNVSNHNEALRRAGASSPNDTIFERIPSLQFTKLYWGVDTPSGGVPGDSQVGDSNDQNDYDP